MYNLLVSYNPQEWESEYFTIDAVRCVREYTDTKITEQFGSLDSTAVDELKRLPCIFAYEAQHKKAPKFGIIKDVSKRSGQVRIQYEIKDIGRFVTFEEFSVIGQQLDIDEWEMNRTHWAVKDVNLAKELKIAYDITLPGWARRVAKTVDIESHVFDVALSFPGEVRSIVAAIAMELERYIGPNSYFYDDNYVSQLARPSLDILLQDIYRHRSKLVVAFLSSDYQRKKWCGLEFRAIREIIMEREHKKVMFVRTDDGNVEGVFDTDGYLDARTLSPADIAYLIQERLSILK